MSTFSGRMGTNYSRLIPVLPDMGEEGNITTLKQLLDRVGESAEGAERITAGHILKVVGRRAFGPLLLVAGLTTLAPLVGDIPGVPTIIGIFTFLIAIQLLMRREQLWLPRWMVDRTVSTDRIRKVLGWLYAPAGFIDRYLKKRLTIFTSGPAAYAIAFLCLSIAMVMPMMEFIPFSANIAGVALTIFGLSLIARDGLLSLIGFLFTAGAIGLVIFIM